MTAKASASAFNSFFYQQQQQQQQEHQKHQQQNPNVTTNTSNLNSTKMDANGMNNGEPVQDLHLKMSKKIAQLTKVSDLLFFSIKNLLKRIN